jgi:hypothetical protein
MHIAEQVSPFRVAQNGAYNDHGIGLFDIELDVGLRLS